MELLNTEEQNKALIEMFESEKECLIIISPFIDIDDGLIKLLLSSTAKIHLFIRTPEPNEREKIISIKKKLKNVNFIEIKFLHAKAYISKECSIITSLNLNKHSQKNNFELGLKFKNNEYSEIYNKLINELRKLLKENGHDMNILDENVIFPTILFYDEYNRKRGSKPKILIMKYLYHGIMEKNKKDWKTDDPNNEIYKKVCKVIFEKFNSEFKSSDYYQDRSALYNQTPISEEIYAYGIKNIII